MKPGYKQTDVGVIPEEWGVTRLSGLVVTGPKNGYSGRSSKDARGTPTLSLGATSSGCMLLNDETVKRLDETIDSRSDLYLKPGDVLVQRSNTPDLVGTTAVFDGPAEVYVYPDLMMRMRFRDDATAHWFWRYANSGNGRRFFVSVAAGSSGSMPKISGEKLRAMQLPLPPLLEQRTISEALSDVDALLDALDRLIAKKRDLKQAAMQQLLTGQTRLPGYHGDWEVKRLGDVTSLIPGGVYGEERPRDTLIPRLVATTAHIEMDDTWNSKEMNVRYFSRDHVERYSPVEGDLIVVKSSGSAAKIQSGKIGFVDRNIVGRFLFSNFLMLLRPIGISPQFLYFYLCSHSVKKLLPTLVEASTYPNIRIPEYLALEIPFPPLPEQIAIAKILSEIDAELAALEQHRDKTRTLKQAMMQELLTGRIRLV